MKVFLERQEKNLELEFEGSAADLLKELGLNAEEVLIVKNGKLVSKDAHLSGGDEVKLLSVVSGG